MRCARLRASSGSAKEKWRMAVSHSGCPPTWASGTEATTYQVNPGHTGAQPDDRLTLPMCQRWRRDLGGWASYAVAAQGLVYVATAGAQGRQLWALDQYSGENHTS